MSSMKYNKGLVIGKFLPLHLGHVHLIDFAFSHCDQLIIALVTKETDEIEASVRISWLKELATSRNRDVVIEVVDEKLPRTEQIEAEAANAWIHYFSKRFTEVDCVFSSESYGAMLANAMNICHIYYDVEREKTQISGSQIRENPMAHLEYLPQFVQDYYKKKECK